MNIDRIFLVFAAAVGLIAAAILVYVPASRTLSLPPYFWVLIALALFDGGMYARGNGAKGTMIEPFTRIAGFVIALGLLFTVPMAAGVDLKMF
jgi:hypothetical protein